MAITSSGQLGVSTIISYLGGTASTGMNSGAGQSISSSALRKLSGVSSGTISLNNFHSKQFWSRAGGVTVTNSPTGGSTTNLGNAQDGSTISWENGTYSAVTHGTTGSYYDGSPNDSTYVEKVSYSNFSNGFMGTNAAGTLYVYFTAHMEDNSGPGSVLSFVEIYLNGSSFIIGENSTTSGGHSTDYDGRPGGAGASTIAISSQNISSLNVNFWASGGNDGVAPPDKSTSSSYINIYDIIFIAT